MKIFTALLLSCFGLSDWFNIFMLVKLAEVPLLLEKLVVMVPAIETVFMGYIV